MNLKRIQNFFIIAIAFVSMTLLALGLTTGWNRTNQFKNLKTLEFKEVYQTSKKLKHFLTPSPGHTVRPTGVKNSSSTVWRLSGRERRLLERSMPVIDHDVLNLDVGRILRGRPLVDYDVNRVMHKLQRAAAGEKCTLRIAKYCASHCEFSLGKAYSEEWRRFRCRFANSCAIETSFVSDLSPGGIMATIDVLIILSSLREGLRLVDLMATRPAGQMWILYSRESPQHDPEYAPPVGTPNPYNLSITYLQEADIYFPYCQTRRHTQGRNASLPKRTKLMAWMSSNCRRPAWKRREFMDELQRHLPIDTYGSCGKLGKVSTADEVGVLTQYKFYLALENSECRDYISEKMWQKALRNGVVPIVYGAPRADYERLAPPDSFIHLEDFGSMQEFVDFIRALDADDSRYYAHLSWRRDFEIACFPRSFLTGEPSVNLCYLIQKLIHVTVNPGLSWHGRVRDFKLWWEGQCSDSKREKLLMGFDVHYKDDGK